MPTTTDRAALRNDAGGVPGSLPTMTSTASTRRRGSTPLSLKALLIAGFLLGAAATVVVVVFSDQVRWLRIGVLLALWAALCAAFAVARSRREAQSVSARETEITRTYELELHREVSARREYESAFTERVRTEVETKHSDELAAVRAQLDRLTAALSNLLDGDVLVERLTLSAESTRLRGLTEAGRTRLAGISHPELGRQRSDDYAIDAELVDDELPDTAEPDDVTDSAVAAEANSTSTGDASGSTVVASDAESREGGDAVVEPAAATATPSVRAGAASSAPTPSAADAVGAAAGSGRAATGGTAVLDRPENVTTQRPVLPSQQAVAPRPAAVAPRPDAPSTAWTRRHRKDIVQAAAGVAADHSARERAAAAEAAAAHEADDSNQLVTAVPYSTFSVVARGPVQMPPLESDEVVAAHSDRGERATELRAAGQARPAGGHSAGHELDPNADDDAGSSRISVAQLVAALGSNAEPSHGRRRAAD